jgi:hypothetical protein
MTGHSRRDDARVHLDRLIDWQERHAPGTTTPINITLSPARLGKLLGKLPRKGGREFEYRGRIVVATAVDTAAMRFRGGI